MNKATIKTLTAQEILDSRGDPTVQVTVQLHNGIRASASVPSGASTGTHEAFERRDGGERYRGKGVQGAVRTVRSTLHRNLRNRSVFAQQDLDRTMRTLDGTPALRRLGANAILGVSLACARAASMAAHIPLYAYLRRCYHLPKPALFPTPMCNVLNGGRHADNGISFQEYLLIPGGRTTSQKLERVARIIAVLKKTLHARGDRTSVGDEGGFAPMVRSNEKGLALLADAIRRAGFRLGADVSIGIDAAASEYYDARAKNYRYMPERVSMNADRVVAWYRQLVARYQLRTIEDPLAEDDWDGWTSLTRAIGKKALLIGDDLFVTQKDRVQRGVDARAANAVLIKPNQVGTLTDTMETIATARRARYDIIVSHRSGETSDDFIADLAVAVGSRYLKAGSLARGERVAKYNRLLAVAEELGR